jgi:hypothetical protein
MQPLVIRSPRRYKCPLSLRGGGFFYISAFAHALTPQKNSVWRIVVGLYGRVSRFQPNRPPTFLNNRGGYLRLRCLFKYSQWTTVVLCLLFECVLLKLKHLRVEKQKRYPPYAEKKNRVGYESTSKPFKILE